MAGPASQSQAESPPATPASDRSVEPTTLAKELEGLSMPDGAAWPKEWEDDEENPRENIAKALAYVRERESYWDSLGVPCHRVTTDAQGNLTIQPRQYPSLAAVSRDDYEDNWDTEYITLTREVPADEDWRATSHRMVGGKRVGWESTTVCKTKVAAFEAEGWEVWYAPDIPLDIHRGYRDYRTVERPVDVFTADQPAADTMRFLEHGNNFVSSAMTEGNWRPGQLIGKDGSDPATTAQSPSFLPPERHADTTESRSATSTGHVVEHAAPPGVDLGWGGYERFARWQSYGRRVTRDMVREEEWETDVYAPFDFVNEAGEVVRTVTVPFARHLLPPQPENLVSLHERLNGPDGKAAGATAEDDSEAIASPQQAQGE